MNIIFDLDGTLIDSAPDIHAAGNTVLAAEGLPGVTPEQARSFIGNGAGMLVSQLEINMERLGSKNVELHKVSAPNSLFTARLSIASFSLVAVPCKFR